MALKSYADVSAEETLELYTFMEAADVLAKARAEVTGI